MNKDFINKDFINKETLQEFIAILTPLSDSNRRIHLKNYIRTLQKVGAYQECRPYFIQLASYHAFIKNNIVSIPLNEYNQDFINQYIIFHFGGTIQNNVCSCPYNPYLIFQLAMQGYKIKGLGKKKKPLTKALTSPYSNFLSEEQKPFIESYKAQGRLLMPHTMGKGKTPSAIIACKERNSRRILLTTTKSTITNWVEEFIKFGLLEHEKSESLIISVIHRGVKFLKNNKTNAVTTYSNKHTLFGQWIKEEKLTDMTDDKAQLQKSHVIIVTHSAMLEAEKLLLFLEKINITIDTLIIDEAHLVANSVTKRGVKLRSITKNIKDILPLTGTPINKISTQEIMFYLDILYPNLIFHGDLHKMFITKEKGKTVFKNVHALHRLIKLIAPHRLIWDEKSTEKYGVGELVVNTVYCESTEELKAKIKEIDKSHHNGLVKSQYKTLAYSPYKKEKAIELIEIALKTKNKIVVFSAFNSVLEALLDKYSENAILITGQTNNRGALIKKFKEDPKCTIFLGNIKAAGIGINLQNADYTIIIEPGYESEKVQQAIKRTHRRGNTSPIVTVDMILVAGEVLENNKENIINKKAYASSMIVDNTGDSVMGSSCTTREYNTSGILDDMLAQKRKFESLKRVERQEKHRNEYDRLQLALNENRQKLIQTTPTTNIPNSRQQYIKRELESTKKYSWYVPSWRK